MTERQSGWRSAGLVVLGAILGIVALGAIRFVGQEPIEHVHYHANWAIFVNGERVDLSGDRYMEDVVRCTVDPSLQLPEDRVHMHENDEDVVHVHASGATWGHLLANIGFGVGDDYLVTDTALYRNGEAGTLKFILNGAPVRSIRNLPIGDEDRLLISYGPEPAAELVETQFTQVASDAGVFDTLPDPASCSGAEEETLGGRIRRAVWF